MAIVIMPSVKHPGKIIVATGKPGVELYTIEKMEILAQEIEIRSSDVVKITEVSRQATELIEKGLEVISQAPEYFYTKLPELKLAMLSDATENAKKRAESMAKASGNKIGSIRSARMGVFQITPVNSFDVSDYGMNDTTSLEKKVNAVVNVEFAIE